MKRTLAVLALCAVSACVPPPPKPIPAISYRDAAQPIGVISRFNEERFAGLWFVCDPAGICGDFAEDLLTERLGKGRYRIVMPDGAERQFWVLWVDEGFRPAVVGNPEGTFGWILDRATTGGSDRIRAAREILDFNGYDLRNLKVME